MSSGLRVAVDIGGTFTDAVVFDPAMGQVFEAKSSTTPADYSRGVFDALEVSQVDLTAIVELIHGTTVVINAITQRAGVRTALVTTRGYRDALQIGRGNRPDMYNLRFHKPEPLVPRRLRFEVAERMLVDGTVETPLDRVRLEEIAATCRDEAVDAVAICFLHAYAWPEHERAAKSILSGLLPGVSITSSSEVCREWREYERTSTAVLNAYVQPILDRYLVNLDQTFDEQQVTDRRFVMLSNGGSATFDFAREQPIQLVESGPAGGIAGALAIGNQIGETHLITLDVGGTTAKCSVIVDGEAAISQDYRLEWTPWSPGYPLRIPVVDIVEIGAGGGSIVWFDEGGALRIGPRSAGADPGPACYGLGGTDPTITDAMILAGILDPASFLGGRLDVDAELAREAFLPVADRLGLSLSETVSGVLRLFGELTVEALKLVSVRRGYDPRDFTLIAYGGGGPIHAGQLARELGVKRLLIPNFPGTFSAWGMLTSQPRIDRARTKRTQPFRQPCRRPSYDFRRDGRGIRSRARRPRIRDRGIDASASDRLPLSWPGAHGPGSNSIYPRIGGRLFRPFPSTARAALHVQYGGDFHRARQLPTDHDRAHEPRAGRFEFGQKSNCIRAAPQSQRCVRRWQNNDNSDL